MNVPKHAQPCPAAVFLTTFHALVAGKRVKLDYEADPDASNPEGTGPGDMPEPAAKDARAGRSYRGARIDTPSHPGGVSSSARESIAEHRERARERERASGVYNTTSVERQRGSDPDYDRRLGEAMRASDAKLREQLDKYRSRPKDDSRDRGHDDHSRNGSGRSHGSGRNSSSRDEHSRDRDYNRDRDRDRPSGSGRSSYDRYTERGSSRSQYAGSTGRDAHDGRREKERESEWDRDDERAGSRGRGEWDPTPQRCVRSGMPLAKTPEICNHSATYHYVFMSTCVLPCVVYTPSPAITSVILSMFSALLLSMCTVCSERLSVVVRMSGR